MGNNLKLKDALQGIGLLFALITSFLGLMYILKGDVLISGLISVVLVVLLVFLSGETIKSRDEISKNKFSFKSIFLWVSYAILCLPMSFLLIHCLNVEIYAKKDIQAMANAKTNSLSEMGESYKDSVKKDLSNLEAKLGGEFLFLTAGPDNEDSKNIIISKLVAPPFNIKPEILNNVTSENYETQIQNLINARKKKSLAVLNLVVQKKNKLFFSKYGDVFNDWNRLQLNYAFYELDTMLSSNYKLLRDGFNNTRFDENAAFTFKLTPDQGIMNKPAELWAKYHPYYLLLVALIFNVILLLPYFIYSGRMIYNNNSLWNNLKNIFKKNSSDDNERLEGGIEIK